MARNLFAGGGLRLSTVAVLEYVELRKALTFKEAMSAFPGHSIATLHLHLLTLVRARLVRRKHMSNQKVRGPGPYRYRVQPLGRAVLLRLMPWRRYWELIPPRHIAVLAAGETILSKLDARHAALFGRATEKPPSWYSRPKAWGVPEDNLRS